MSDKIALLPCPFCGSAARLESNRDWHRIIVDHDEQCVFLEPEVVMVPATDGQLSLAVADWNRRAALAQQPATAAVPAVHALLDSDSVPDDFRNQASGYRAGWNDCLAATTAAPVSVQEPSEEAAYQIGAKGAEPTESERRLFEAWMGGHCWAVAGEWNGKTYVAADEDGRCVNQHAMLTRQLWAAWRDRAALACSAAPAATPQVALRGRRTFWVLFDATTDQRFIKKMMPEGFLAFFDCEADARRAMARNPGADYKRVDYYTATAEQPARAINALATISRMARNEACRSGIPVAGKLCTWDAIADMADAALADAEQPDTVKVRRRAEQGELVTALFYLSDTWWINADEHAEYGRTGEAETLRSAARELRTALSATPRQPDTVKVQRELLAEAVAELLFEPATAEFIAARRALASKLDALLAGGDEA